MALFEAHHDAILTEHEDLRRAFIAAGISEKEAGREVIRFWEWDRNREQPHIRIFAYMFAAFSRRIVAGQRKVTPGFMADVRTISAYAPYVDAMFIDNECAALLAEGPLADELEYKARIFSLSSREAFLDYLAGVEAGATAEVLTEAARLYGVT